MNKILFDWTEFSDREIKLSKTEEIVITEHFKTWIDSNSFYKDCSGLELEEKFNIFRSAWIMANMFTNS